MRGKHVLTLMSAIVFVVGSFSAGWAKVSVEILQDVYVLPVAELATTKTHPEIVRIGNDLIEVTLIPNRGRVLSSYIVKGKESESFIYCNFVPKPMVLPGGLHVVEFGGYYLSLPWNDRDRQPFDLSFALAHEEEDLAEVFLSGKDMFRKTLTECWVRIRDRSPVVEIEIAITNLSKKETKTLLLRDFAVLDVDDDCFLALPTATVKVLESRGDWLGEPGKTMEWPAAFASWGGMKDYLRFGTEGSPTLPCTALIYPDRGVAFVKWWEPKEFFSSLEIWSWGQSWVSEPGADAYIVVSSVCDDLVLKPQERKSFKVYFVALEGVSQDTTLQVLLDRSKSLTH